MDVKDKVVVVTGGADGIGAALARRFAKAGAAQLVVVDRNGEGAAAVAQEFESTRRVLSWLREQGCPARYLDLPRQMRERAA